MPYAPLENCRKELHENRDRNLLIRYPALCRLRSRPKLSMANNVIPERSPAHRPDSTGYFDKFGKSTFGMNRFRDGAYPPPWCMPDFPFDRPGRIETSLGESVPDRQRYVNRRKTFSPDAYSFHLSQMQSSRGNVHEAWVRQYASGLMPSVDVAVDLVLDASRNVYVTGYSQSVPGGYGYLTIKYDSFGKILWSTRYNSETPYGDYACALALDKFGNIYVTGSGRGEDITTVKYDASGIEQWVSSYDGPEHDIDWPADLAVDDAGNVYVAGASIGESGYQRNHDYTLIKYGASGTQHWVARYANVRGGNDHVVALAVDELGNVYVTGASYGQANDYATIKYNSSGTQVWVARYSGTENSADEAAALAVDQFGNVYVTGKSEGANTAIDCATVKYSPDGVEEWCARYNGPANQDDFGNAIVVAPSGDVIVTGSSQNDYVTLKYSPSGIEQWVASYDGPAGGNDEASEIALDELGNICVTGRSAGPGTPSNPYDYDYCTIKFNSLGVQEWAERYDAGENCDNEPAALALDRVGNIHITGRIVCPSTSADYGTVKYSSSGILSWQSRYAGPPSSQDDAVALDVDGAGNIYVTGSSHGWNTGYDFATAKYHPSGDVEWIARYNSPNNASETALSQAVDRAGNVYVTGGTVPDATDYITVKYNSSGRQEWVARYNGPNSPPDWPAGIAADDFGNVYVGGWSGRNVSPASRDYAIVKYNASGGEEWVARYDGPANSDDWATDLAVDALGNVHVTGTSNWQATTVKYNTSGIQEWVVRYPQAHGTALALDDSGNVYVSGDTWARVSDDYFTIKYSASGVVKWVALYDGPGRFAGSQYLFSEDEAVAVAMNSSGGVYVTGTSSGNLGWAVAKYDAAGTTEWVRAYNGWSVSYARNRRSLAVDELGNAYLISTDSESGSFDFATVKYDPAGIQEWAIRHNSPGNSNDYVRGISLDALGNIYVTGTNTGEGTWSTWTTIKYVQTPVSVKEPEPGQPNAYRLLQNYPNPFNPSTTIRYTLAKPGRVALKIFNLAGQEVATLVNEIKAAGEHETLWRPDGLPSGVYVYRLLVGDPSGSGGQDFVETKKLLLLK